jgi:acyl transferase domain-containing protein
MDPQQRLLLEKSWEALTAVKHDGALATRTAVIVGIGTVDYTSISSHLGVGIYVATGLPQQPSLSLYELSPAALTKLNLKMIML